jgi:ABC-type molybdate transport system substrate-binding protein
LEAAFTSHLICHLSPLVSQDRIPVSPIPQAVFDFYDCPFANGQAEFGTSNPATCPVGVYVFSGDKQNSAWATQHLAQWGGVCFLWGQAEFGMGNPASCPVGVYVFSGDKHNSAWATQQLAQWGVCFLWGQAEFGMGNPATCPVGVYTVCFLWGSGFFLHYITNHQIMSYVNV